MSNKNLKKPTIQKWHCR